MMSPATDSAAHQISVQSWRDFDEYTLSEPGMSLGATTVTSSAAVAARTFYDTGVRRVRLMDPIDLAVVGDAITAVRALTLVRELTGQGIAVDWRLRPAEESFRWQTLSHLYPPAHIEGHDGRAQRDWFAAYHFCKCCYRQGPGFIQVRDRRSQNLRRITIDEPKYHAAINDLLDGVSAADVPPGILRDLTTAGLVDQVGTTAWWLPYRVRRWPRSYTLV